VATGLKKRHGFGRRLLNIAVSILLAIPVLGVLVWLYLLTSLPKTEGEIDLPILAGPVLIDRSVDGIPTIVAEQEADAFRALGYIHAQDRLFQMDLMRRVGQGRLAEVAGSFVVNFDKLLRAFDFYSLAQQQYEAMNAEHRAILDAYAEGVNAFLEHPGGALPIEYLPFLVPTPEPWKPADSIVWAKIMALQLSGNLRDEIARTKLKETLTVEQIEDLWSGPANIEAATLAGIPDLLAPPSASNAWVISGDRTKSGKPILANDPHLMFQAPNIWYLARIETPTLTLAGATTPGVPLVVIGHNTKVAWGFTTTHSDTQDLFVETIDPENPTHYLTPDGSRPFEFRNETINVRFAEPVDMTVRSTRNGVVISDLQEDAAEITPPGSVMALAWPALRPGDITPSVFFELNRTDSANNARLLMRDVGAPHQNIFLADIDGDIGFIAPATVPLRNAGDGRVPVPGADGSHDWTGTIPTAALPQEMNPAKGYFANGNNRIVTEDYPYLITKDWQAPYRGKRLNTLIAAAENHTLDDSRRLMMDTVSPMARALLPKMLDFTPTPGQLAEAHAMLARWDSDMNAGRPEPLIFTAWLRELSRSLYGDETGDLLSAIWHWHPGFIETALSEKNVWCDDISTLDAVESCEMVLQESLQKALAFLDKRMSGEMVSWKWGDMHQARFPHPVLGRLPVVGRLFTLSVPTGGDNSTINRGTPRIANEAKLFDHVHGASLRVIFDLSDLDQSEFIIPAGQSGNPLSGHFGDLLERWRDGVFLTLPKARVDAEDRRRLLLIPGSSASE